eukprot:TRINITY_DN7376_c0_g1_i1.p1 TRINITY_DN7376_c0_g1~~TRINITY_DN7376_c0_g1_i1.p1  ORF type:complete len:373 (+),score=126.76 TRINITY_DN7376_c0_g1_i1:32-1120(+)
MVAFKVLVYNADGLENTDHVGKSDPYVHVFCDGQVQTTKVVDNSLTPTWNQEFTFTAENPANTTVLFTVWDNDPIKSHQFMGVASMPLTLLRRDKPITLELPLWKHNRGGRIWVVATALDFDGILAEVEQLHSVQEALTAEVAELKTVSQTLKEETTRLHGEVDHFHQENDRLEATRGKLEQDVATFTSKLGVMSDQVEHLKHTRELLDAQVTRQEEQNKQLHEELGQLRTIEEGIRQFTAQQGADYAQFVEQLTGNIHRHEALLQDFAAENSKLRENRRKQQVDSLLSLSNCFQHWDHKVGLSVDEFRSYLQLLGPSYELRLRQLVGGTDERIFGQLDKDGSGTLNVSELRAALEQLVQDS